MEGAGFQRVTLPPGSRRGGVLTQASVLTLTSDGVLVCGPNEGDMACGEHGPGRMSEPLEIVATVEAALADGSDRLREASARWAVRGCDDPDLAQLGWNRMTQAPTLSSDGVLKSL